MRPKPRSIMLAEHGLRGMHHADHVLLEHVAELLGLRLGKRRAGRGAGIGDEDVDRAARGHGLADPAVHGFRVGDVGDHVARRLALPHHLGERLFAAARDGDGGAGLRQGCRNGAADAAAAAGHKCVLSLKRTHFRSTRCCGETCEFQPIGLLCGNYFRLKLFRLQVPDGALAYAEGFSAVIPGRSRMRASPESSCWSGSCDWIPGSPLRGAPE